VDSLGIAVVGSLGIAVVGYICGGVFRASHEKHPHIFPITTENPKEPCGQLFRSISFMVRLGPILTVWAVIGPDSVYQQSGTITLANVIQVSVPKIAWVSLLPEHKMVIIDHSRG